MVLTTLLLAVAVAIVQVGAVPSAFAQPLAAPVLPIALLAGWSAARRPRETWPVPIATAVVLGAMSEARVGTFLLALLPALLLAALARARERRGEATALRRLALATLAGAGGTACYVLLLNAGAQGLWLPGGSGTSVLTALSALAGGCAWTGLLAAALAAVLWPFRTDSGGLFA